MKPLAGASKEHMNIHLTDRHRKTILTFVCSCLLVFLSACSGIGQTGNGALPPAASPTQQGGVSVPGQGASPTATPTGEANSAASRVSPSVTENMNHPVLAFYYPWYSTSTWCSCTMSDLPTISYNSSDESTIERQVNWAANAGITGFISSWWGTGDPTDKNFAKLLAYAATLEKTTGYQFASTIYFE